MSCCSKKQEKNIEKIKKECECPSCQCTFDAKKSVEKDGKHYCSQTCCSQCASEKCSCEDCCK